MSDPNLSDPNPDPPTPGAGGNNAGRGGGFDLKDVSIFALKFILGIVLMFVVLASFLGLGFKIYHSVFFATYWPHMASIVVFVVLVALWKFISPMFPTRIKTSGPFLHNTFVFVKILAVAVVCGIFSWIVTTVLIGDPRWVLGISSGVFFCILGNMVVSGIVIVPSSQFRGILLKNNQVVPKKSFEGGWYLTIPLFSHLDVKPVYTGHRTEQIKVPNCFTADGYLVMGNMSITVEIFDPAAYFPFLLNGDSKELWEGFESLLKVSTIGLVRRRVQDRAGIKDFSISAEEWDIITDPEDPPTRNPQPNAQTDVATGISQDSVTLTGRVNPNGSDTVYWFEYGVNGLDQMTNQQPVGDGTVPRSFVSRVDDLIPGTSYYFRIVAQNQYGVSFGQVLMFITAGQNQGGNPAHIQPPVQPVLNIAQPPARPSYEDVVWYAYDRGMNIKTFNGVLTETDKVRDERITAETRVIKAQSVVKAAKELAQINGLDEQMALLAIDPSYAAALGNIGGRR